MKTNGTPPTPLTEQEIREAFATRWGCLGTPENEEWTRRALAGDPEAMAELRSCHRDLVRRQRRAGPLGQAAAESAERKTTATAPRYPGCACSACGRNAYTQEEWELHEF